MNDLIKINANEEKPTVSGRELHKVLEIETPYVKWFNRMCEYGFTENEDYRVTDIFVPNSGGGKQTLINHNISISMAKEICMIQRTDKGRQIRKYFIKVEEDWNSPEKVMARALEFANRSLSNLKQININLNAKIEEDRPKVLFASSVEASKTSILVSEMAKLLKQNGIDIGQKRLFEWLREKGYLIKRCGTERNMPTQKAMEMGLFEVKETSITHADGHITVNKTPKVTGKGQIYFINKFLR